MGKQRLKILWGRRGEAHVNVNVICLPTKHQVVHKNSFRNVRAFQDRIGIWKCWFLRRGENRSTRRKTSRNREENQQQTQPTYDAGSRNRTRDTLVGGERSHHCAIPAPLVEYLGSHDITVQRSAMRALEQLGKYPDSYITVHRIGIVKVTLQARNI